MYHPMGMTLDGIQFHCIDLQRIPPSHISMPVRVIDDYGEYPSTMIGGSVGYQVTSSGKAIDTTTELIDHSRHAMFTTLSQPSESITDVKINQSSGASIKNDTRMTRMWSKLRTRTSETPESAMNSIEPVETEAIAAPEEGSDLDSLQPVSGWWLFENKEGSKTLNGEDAPQILDDGHMQDQGLAVDKGPEEAEDEALESDLRTRDKFLVEAPA